MQSDVDRLAQEIRAMRQDHGAVVAGLQGEIKRLQAALNTDPVLTDEQRDALTTGFGAILPATEVFELGWRTALEHVRRALEQNALVRPGKYNHEGERYD